MTFDLICRRWRCQMVMASIATEVMSVAVSAPRHQPEAPRPLSYTFLVWLSTLCLHTHVPYLHRKAKPQVIHIHMRGKNSKHWVTSSQLPVSSRCHDPRHLHTFNDWWVMSQWGWVHFAPQPQQTLIPNFTGKPDQTWPRYTGWFRPIGMWMTKELSTLFGH